ncbi:phosphoribosylglycinamide formyltransferase [Acidithiobacillus sp. AMEEHan]|uniref:phosphoribosylglycinamide formyltransferase n=1 Tax=Acidithiobacillus sp. AMEEHan TaxID=2994951 RepID=UPI0027E58D96|nr:phosphoribosylglycinamide formyltransferase [Acidithiobacillus sp. AMEEHan]
MTEQRLVVLISGRGSNLRAIQQACASGQLPARISAVISNRADAAGLAWCRDAGLAADVIAHQNFATRADFDHSLAAAIDTHNPDWVILAGFMRQLTDSFVHRYLGRLINIHPSLLPAFPGLHTHQQALHAGVRWHGATVHFVTPELDAGPIIAQGVLPVLSADTPESLSARVLALEHQLYPQALGHLLRGDCVLQLGQTLWRHGYQSPNSARINPQGQA